MVYSKKRKSRNNKNKKTHSRNKNKKTRNRNKNKTHSRNKNKKTRNRNKNKNTLIGHVGGSPYNLDRLLIHVHRNKIPSFNTIEKTFNRQITYKPSIIVDALQSFKIDNFSILGLINYLKVDNKNIVLFNSEETFEFEYLVFYVKDDDLKYFSFSTHEFLDYIHSNRNPLYTMTDYFWGQLNNHIMRLGNLAERGDNSDYSNNTGNSNNPAYNSF
jgi:hypothetical protein